MEVGWNSPFFVFKMDPLPGQPLADWSGHAKNNAGKLD